jgi:hypothetical protein
VKRRNGSVLYKKPARARAEQARRHAGRAGTTGREMPDGSGSDCEVTVCDYYLPHHMSVLDVVLDEDGHRQLRFLNIELRKLSVVRVQKGMGLNKTQGPPQCLVFFNPLVEPLAVLFLLGRPLGVVLVDQFLEHWIFHTLIVCCGRSD